MLRHSRNQRYRHDLILDPFQLGPLRNTGITKLNYNGTATWTLDWFNSVSHLPADLVGQGEGTVNEL